MLNFYRRLIALRKSHPVLVEGDFNLIDAPSEDVFAYLRSPLPSPHHPKHKFSGPKYLVIMNFTEETVHWQIPEEERGELLGRPYVRGEVLVSTIGEGEEKEGMKQRRVNDYVSDEGVVGLRGLEGVVLWFDEVLN